jgi:hypothetical protein
MALPKASHTGHTPQRPPLPRPILLPRRCWPSSRLPRGALRPPHMRWGWTVAAAGQGGLHSCFYSVQSPRVQRPRVWESPALGDSWR